MNLSDCQVCIDDDIWAKEIFGELCCVELCKVSKVCKKFNDIIQNHPLAPKITRYDHPEIPPLICTHPSNSAERGHIKCLKYFYEKGWDILGWETMIKAIRGGNVETVKYLIDMGAELVREYPCVACEDDNLQLLKCLCENGCKVDAMSVMSAAKHDALQCLEYLNSFGLSMNVAPLTAVRFGSLRVFEYLVRIGDVKPSYIFVAYAAKNGHLEILKRAIQIGCPYAAYMVSEARSRRHEKCATYLEGLLNE